MFDLKKYGISRSDFEANYKRNIYGEFVVSPIAVEQWEMEDAQGNLDPTKVDNYFDSICLNTMAIIDKLMNSLLLQFEDKNVLVRLPDMVVEGVRAVVYKQIVDTMAEFDPEKMSSASVSSPGFNYNRNPKTYISTFDVLTKGAKIEFDRYKLSKFELNQGCKPEDNPYFNSPFGQFDFKFSNGWDVKSVTFEGGDKTLLTKNEVLKAINSGGDPSFLPYIDAHTITAQDGVYQLALDGKPIFVETNNNDLGIVLFNSVIKDSLKAVLSGFQVVNGQAYNVVMTVNKGDSSAQSVVLSPIKHPIQDLTLARTQDELYNAAVDGIPAVVFTNRDEYKNQVFSTVKKGTTDVTLESITVISDKVLLLKITAAKGDTTNFGLSTKQFVGGGSAGSAIEFTTTFSGVNLANVGTMYYVEDMVDYGNDPTKYNNVPALVYVKTGGGTTIFFDDKYNLRELLKVRDLADVAHRLAEKNEAVLFGQPTGTNLIPNPIDGTVMGDALIYALPQGTNILVDRNYKAIITDISTNIEYPCDFIVTQPKINVPMPDDYTATGVLASAANTFTLTYHTWTPKAPDNKKTANWKLTSLRLDDLTGLVDKVNKLALSKVYKGTYATLVDLKNNYPEGAGTLQDGDYATVGPVDPNATPLQYQEYIADGDKWISTGINSIPNPVQKVVKLEQTLTANRAYRITDRSINNDFNKTLEINFRDENIKITNNSLTSINFTSDRAENDPASWDIALYSKIQTGLKDLFLVVKQDADIAILSRDDSFLEMDWVDFPLDANYVEIVGTRKGLPSDNLTERNGFTQTQINNSQALQDNEILNIKTIQGDFNTNLIPSISDQTQATNFLYTQITGVNPVKGIYNAPSNLQTTHINILNQNLPNPKTGDRAIVRWTNPTDGNIEYVYDGGTNNWVKLNASSTIISESHITVVPEGQSIPANVPQGNLILVVGSTLDASDYATKDYVDNKFKVGTFKIYTSGKVINYINEIDAAFPTKAVFVYRTGVGSDDYRRKQNLRFLNMPRQLIWFDTGGIDAAVDMSQTDLDTVRIQLYIEQ